MVAVAGLALGAIGLGTSIFGATKQIQNTENAAASQKLAQQAQTQQSAAQNQALGLDYQATQAQYRAQQGIYGQQQNIYGAQQNIYGLQGSIATAQQHYNQDQNVVNQRIDQGLNIQYQGGLQAAAAQSDIVSAQRQQQIYAEGNFEQQNALRQRQMQLDATRANRESVRAYLANRSLALATSTASGSQFGSGLQGAYGQGAGRTGVNVTGVNQNLNIGNALFTLSNQSARQSLSTQLNVADSQQRIIDAQNYANSGENMINQANSLSRYNANYLQEAINGYNAQISQQNQSIGQFQSTINTLQSQGLAEANAFTSDANQYRMQANTFGSVVNSNISSANQYMTQAGVGGAIFGFGNAVTTQVVNLPKVSTLASSVYNKYMAPPDTTTGPAAEAEFNYAG